MMEGQGEQATQRAPRESMDPDAMCELRYPLTRGSLDLGADSRLHAAVCAAVPSWHGEDGRGVQVVGGVGDGRCLLVRAPVSKMREAEALEGRLMFVGRKVVTLGPMQARALPTFLAPVTLGAWLVSPTFTKSGSDRSGYDAQRFLAWLARSLEGLEVGCVVVGPQGAIPLHGSLYQLGHALALHGVSPSSARVLLARGLGGKMKMGCGCLMTVEDWPDLGAGRWPARTPQGARYVGPSVVLRAQGGSAQEAQEAAQDAAQGAQGVG